MPQSPFFIDPFFSPLAYAKRTYFPRIFEIFNFSFRILNSFMFSVHTNDQMVKKRGRRRGWEESSGEDEDEGENTEMGLKE